MGDIRVLSRFANLASNYDCSKFHRYRRKSLESGFVACIRIAKYPICRSALDLFDCLQVGFGWKTNTTAVHDNGDYH